jgi:hypothetical protein
MGIPRLRGGSDWSGRGNGTVHARDRATEGMAVNERHVKCRTGNYLLHAGSLRAASSIVLLVALLLLVPAARGQLQDAASAQDYPRIAML